MTQWHAAPVNDWEQRLYQMVERVLALRPAVERYEEMTNLLHGLMMTADLKQITVPGQGRVTLQDGKLTVTTEGTLNLRPFL